MQQPSCKAALVAGVYISVRGGGELIPKEYCEGCDYWRYLSSSRSMMCCHYLVDRNSPSRTALGQLSICHSRKVNGIPKERALSHKYDVAPKPQRRYAQYLSLYKKGLTDRQIAEKAGANVTAVANWRWRAKMPPNKKGEAQGER